MLLAACIFAIALLYASVGQAGASGYLAAMALFGIATESMRPAALLLNVFVGAISVVRFWRSGCFDWRTFWPFAVTSIPFAFLGGLVDLPDAVFRPLVGLILLFSAYRLIRQTPVREATRPPLGAALLSGAAIGLLSSISGTGGGIFLTPLLLFAGWADAKRAAGVSAAFVLVNSLAGLAGLRAIILPPEFPFWIVAAVTGGVIGTDHGIKHLGSVWLQRLLAVVLTVAAAKLLIG